MADIVITEFMDEAAAASMQGSLYDPALVDKPKELKEALADARAIVVRNRTQVTVELLDAAPNLACVGRLGVGLDNIDLDACAARGVTVYPATGANDLSVAEYVITSAMVLLRGAYLGTGRVAAGAWPRQEMSGRELAGKVMGLIGFGAIAREVALRAKLLGMDVLATDPHVMADDLAWQFARNVSRDAVLENADIVSLHVPLTDGTRHMINAAAISSMKSDAILINAARGGVVDEAALVGALKNQELGGAALDVFENEPVTAETGTAFAGVPNLILTPHIAGVTQESNGRVSTLIAQRVSDHLAKLS
ncbi:MAG: hydroxyacid dehydrogenase [Pseudomonadota bacterium]